MKKSSFSLKDRAKSFEYALNGLKVLVDLEHNARIHLVAALGSIALGWFLEINLLEWAVLVLCIALVIGAELFNSAIEHTCNAITLDRHPKIKLAKDLAAAGVLIFSIAAMVVGGLLFVPKIAALLH